MKATYYGHSCFSIELSGIKLLFDPFISPNPLAADINIDTIEADYILISHGHEDHVADAIPIAQRTEATIISTYEIVVWFQNQGIDKGHPMNTGGEWTFDFGKVKCVNAVHSSVLPDGTYGANPIGFVIQSNDTTIYYAGDTALTYDMKLLGDYHAIDLAFLPIGSNFTMGIDDAVIAADFIKCNEIIGMHYDTFDYIKINKSQALEKFKNAGKSLKLIDIGSTIEY